MFHLPLEFHDGANIYLIPGRTARDKLVAIAREGLWECVSVSKKFECPTWEEMCRVKLLFWDLDDCVVQYHYMNSSAHCLYLLRPVNQILPLPPDKF